MKKICIVVLVAILIGFSFAIYIFNGIATTIEETNNDNKVYAFQVGVFSIYENAQKLALTFDNAYIYQDNDKYRVFLAIYQDPEIVSYMSDYYESKNVSVYLKNINPNDEFIEELNKYEVLLKKSNNKTNYIDANKNILATFRESL